MAPAGKRRVLIIGGQFAGNFCARDMKKHFNVTVVDAKEFFEYTPGVLRAYVKPAHFDSLSFTLQPVYERKIGVKFIWGEVEKLDGDKKCATINTIFAGTDVVSYDYCIICCGCNFNPIQPKGESLWFPTVHKIGREVSEWKHIDERFIEGRRRHILEEYHKISELNKKKATVLVVGAGFIGVEWVTELEHFFPNLKLTIMDFLPRCLGPLPEIAAEYCTEYMSAVGIQEFYKMKYDKNDKEMWKTLMLPDGADISYICMGVKPSNYFMPPETLSLTGPGGGGWIVMNEALQVTHKDERGAPAQTWGGGKVFAVGDCNAGGIQAPGVDMKNPGNGPDGKPRCPWAMWPVPKISYPGEEQALHAVKNIERLDAADYGWHGCIPYPRPSRGADGLVKLNKTWWPWGAGMFATSLGPHDACFVLAANHQKGSGYMVNWWIFAALQKEIIETTKINECKDIWIGKCIWHFVHHTPCNLWGKGPWIP